MINQYHPHAESPCLTSLVTYGMSDRFRNGAWSHPRSSDWKRCGKISTSPLSNTCGVAYGSRSVLPTKSSSQMVDWYGKTWLNRFTLTQRLVLQQVKQFYFCGFWSQSQATLARCLGNWAWTWETVLGAPDQNVTSWECAFRTHQFNYFAWSILINLVV